MKGKRIIIAVAGILFFALAHGQKLAPGKYWIPLRDKQYNEYSLAFPERFLSPAALHRRYVQHIPLDDSDLPVSSLYVDSLRSMGLKILGTSRWFNALVVQSDDSLLLDTLSSVSFVGSFDPYASFFIHSDLQSIQKEAETGFKSTFPGSENYGISGIQISLLKGNLLHELGYRGDSVQIAVLDAGFYRVDSLEAFRRLRDEGRILGTRDFVKPGGNVYKYASHGMSVLSTMAGYIPDTLIGTAPDASYWLLRTEDASSEYRIEEANWLLAAEFADSAGADIISSSLGYSSFSDSTMNYNYALMDGKTALVTRAADKAFSKGMLVVVSAGNEGNKAWGYITAPADGENVIAVGAVDDFRAIASFSSRGPTFDNRVKPDVDAVGFQTVIVNASGGVSPGYGTSFAAPQIAGMAACLWQAYPGKTNRELLNAIRKSANQYALPDTIYGYGIPDFMIAFWSLAAGDSTNQSRPLIAWPNPFTDISGLSIVNTNEQIREICIFSSTGKKEYAKYGSWNTGDHISLDHLTPLDPGVYFLVARSEGKEFVLKLIKQ